MIGNVFVQQYYSIMSTTLDELYKFYNNGSTLHVCGVGVPPLPGADAMGDQTVRLYFYFRSLFICISVFVFIYIWAIGLTMFFCQQGHHR